MFNYAFGAATATVILAMVDIIDTNVPNNLSYWVGQIISF